MAAVKRNPIKYPGVYYREVKRTGSPQETEKVFYTRQRKDFLLRGGCLRPFFSVMPYESVPHFKE